MAKPNLQASTAQKIIFFLKNRGSASATDIIKLLQIPRSTATSILKMLYDNGQIHVTDWIQYPNRSSLRIYAWGAGEDVVEVRKVAAEISEEDLLALPWPRCDVAASWVERRAA